MVARVNIVTDRRSRCEPELLLFRLEVDGEFGHIHIVPGFDDLTIAAGDERGAGGGGVFSGGGEAEGVAGVDRGGCPAGGDAVSFGDNVVDFDVDAAEDVLELTVDGFE